MEQTKKAQKSIENISKTRDMLLAMTFTRHANLPEKEFLKRIGRKKTENEEQAVRESILNLLMAITKQELYQENQLEELNRLQKMIKGETEMKKEEEKATIQTAEIDESAIKEMTKNIELGLSNPQQIGRTILNALCEILSIEEKKSASLGSFASIYSISHDKEIQEYINQYSNKNAKKIN